MNQPNILVKAITIASSLLLACGFILYNAGAFDDVIAAGPLAPAETSIDGASLRVMLQSPPPDTPDAATSDTVTPQPADTAARRREFFSGSKSAAPLIKLRKGDTAGARASDTAGKNHPLRRRDRFMGGSKSLAPLIAPPVSDSQDAPRSGISDSSKPSKRVP